MEGRAVRGSFQEFLAKVPLRTFAEALKFYAEALQPAVTVLAILAAGVWTYKLFIQNRQKYPRANVTHSFTAWKLGSERVLVHVAVRIENIGQSLISIQSGFVRLQQVLPLEGDLLRQIECGEDAVCAGESEILYPELAARICDWKKAPREIEPTETDAFHFDFVLPASAEIVEVYSHFENMTKRRRMIGWNCTTLHQMRRCTHVQLSGAQLPMTEQDQRGASDE